MTSYTAKQTELIENFKDILHYGYRKMEGVEIQLMKTRYKKKILAFMMTGTQSYSESILKLVGTTPIYDKAAEVLLRSIMEISINISFVYSNRTNKNALLFIVDILLGANNFAKKHHRFWDTHPTWKLEFGKIKKPCDWDEFILKNKYDVLKLAKKCKIKIPNKIPNLFDRTVLIDIDQKLKNKLSEKNSAEKYYLYFYNFFSEVSHLSMSGLNRFLNYNQTSNRPESFMIDAKPEDSERILQVAYQFYLPILKFFLKEFKRYDKAEFSKYIKYSKKLLKGN